MNQLEQQHAARDEYDQFMGSFPSRQAVQQFLFQRAQVFVAAHSQVSRRSGEILVPRKERRQAARQIAKRLTRAARDGEVV